MMTRYCCNCERPIGEFELGFGPDAMGCVYCTANCPNCGREVFDTEKVQKEKLKKQEERLRKTEEKLRKSKIDLVKLSVKVNKTLIPKSLEDLSDEELDKMVEPLMKRFMKGDF